jgi:CarD family transcriptional regulator
MAVKKTVKSSKAKQAKQIRTPKAKTPKHPVELKAKKTAVERARAVRTRSAKKVGRELKSNGPSAAAKATSGKLAAKKSAARKKVSARRAIPRASGRSAKKGPVARCIKTAPRVTTIADESVALKPVSTRASQRIASQTRPQAKQPPAQAKQTASTEPARRGAAKLAATARKAVGTSNRGTQKPAATKAAAAAILSLKRKSTSPRMAADHEKSPSTQPTSRNSSSVNVLPKDRMTIINSSGKSVSSPPDGGAAQESTSRIQTDNGFARIPLQGQFKGLGKPIAPTAPGSPALLPGENRPEAAAMISGPQSKSVKPGLFGRSMAPAQKPAKTANLPRPPFKLHEFVVYPAHGVGQIIAIEEQEVAGFTLELFVLSFVKDKMILKVPVTKAVSVGMRKLAEAGAVNAALDTLAGRARIKRSMWSRRAQEYEAKINSGDLNAIAEVVRDLYRSDMQPEQSYSERQLYEAALDRLAREIIVVQKLTETESLKVIEAHLQKGPRRGKVEDREHPDIEEAA